MLVALPINPSHGVEHNHNPSEASASRERCSGLHEWKRRLR